jgi:DNA-binding CsgD family transcriptional regulator
MRALLARLSAAGPPPGSVPGPGAAPRVDPGYLAALLRTCDRADAVSRGRAVAALPGLAEPLTERELEVLRLIAAGRSNQRIAHDLVVALDTVKKHVTRVLGKLGAAQPHRGRGAGPGARPDPVTRLYTTTGYHHRVMRHAPRLSTRQAPSGDAPRGPGFVPFTKSRATRHLRRMSCTIRLPICGRSPSPGPPRSRR